MNLAQTAAPFMWRDRKGNMHNPKDMETRHIFMTLVVIWNCVMPGDVRINRSGEWVHHAYYLGPFYTKDYLAQGICVLVRELSNRQDLEVAWTTTLDRMIYTLAEHAKEDITQLKDLT